MMSRLKNMNRPFEAILSNLILVIIIIIIIIIIIMGCPGSKASGDM